LDFPETDGGRLRQTALPPQPPFAGHQTRRDADHGAAFFKQSFELKIKGDMIPEAAAEEIIGEFQALFARHNFGGRAECFSAAKGTASN